NVAPTEHTTPHQQLQKPTNSASTPPMVKGKETAQPMGKYSPTPVLNDLIMRASKVMLQGQDTATPLSTHSATPSTDL
ncbi:12643_t:CDS:1, partial [Dentiscutata erythropus]